MSRTLTPSIVARALLTMASAVEAATAREASCFCGAVKLRVAASPPPLAVSICHCSTCRKLTGSPMLANLMLPAKALDVPDDAALVSQATSKYVTRHRCAACYSPTFARLGKDKVVVPLALFDAPHPETWVPQQHIYYDQRVLDVNDGLPKFRAHFGSEQCADDGSPKTD